MAEDGSSVEKQWYVPPRPPTPQGWSVYTIDRVLAILQGCASEPEKARRTPGWLIVGTVVQAVLWVIQAVVMVLAWVPIVSSLLETFLRVYSRRNLGSFLRGCYWKARLAHLGQDTVIDPYVDIYGAESISIGSRTHIDTHVRLGAGVRRQGQHGRITIGSYVYVGRGVHITGRGGVDIGDMAAVSSGAQIYSATNVVEHPHDPGQLISLSHAAPPDQQYIIEAPVVIEEMAFVGMLARIMPGVRVGRGAVIHGDTEVTRDVPAFANFGGLPRGRQIGWRKPRRPSPKLPDQTPPGGSAASGPAQSEEQ